MGLALIVTDRSVETLRLCLKRSQPALDIQVWPDISRPSDVTVAVLWKQPQGLLAKLTHLQAVISLGAGIDFIEQDPDLQKHVRIHRIVTENLKQQMAQYVLAYILHDFRHLSLYHRQQQKQLWKIKNLADQATIGFLGLGEIGKFVAMQCQNLGFSTLAFTHSSKDHQITCFHQQQGLHHVIQHSDYLVCILPLTKQTKGIVNFEVLSHCQKQPVFIHVGRGQQVVEVDLVRALDKGLIKKAIIDVFSTEPLPKDSSLWQHKNISITPHNAARSDEEQTASQILKIIEVY